jgi:hypothetical protein
MLLLTTISGQRGPAAGGTNGVAAFDPIIEGRRYYRDCWWDWGQRRCELKPWW